MKLHRIIPILWICLGAACRRNPSPDPLPFPTSEVRSVTIERHGDGGRGRTPLRDTLAADLIPEFVEGLRKAEDRGVGKVGAPYVITLKLDGGDSVMLPATETVFIYTGPHHLYAFVGGRYFLGRYFPAMFEDTVGGIQNISNPDTAGAAAPDLDISATTIAALRRMRAEKKFTERGIYHPVSETARVRLESMLNALLDRLIAGVAADPRKSYVLTEFMATLKYLDHDDSEDKDRMCGYLEDIMDIVGIQSSDGLLNTWRYGW